MSRSSIIKETKQLKPALKRMQIDGNNSISSKDSFLYDRIENLSQQKDFQRKKSSVGFGRNSIEEKRKRSSIHLIQLFPRRKSLQTTAIAIRRQSLWMNLAKTPSTNPEDLYPNANSSFPLDETNDFIRKKILRFLLVFSYLISISLLAIALATFYGFFYSTTDLNSISSTTISSLINQTNFESI